LPGRGNFAAKKSFTVSVVVWGSEESAREGDVFLRSAATGGGAIALENRREFLEENGEEFLTLQQALQRLGAELERLPSKPEEVFNFSRRAQELQVQLGFLMESEDRNTVFWIERRNARGGGPGRSSVMFSSGYAD